MTTQDRMNEALAMAAEAVQAGDHPYGAVIIGPSGAITERNRVASTTDPTAHSEVSAIRAAAKAWGIEAVAGSTLVTSFEPCPMCLGAILEAGITTLVMGARRTIGEAPLGNYTVEDMLALTGRTSDLALSVCGLDGRVDAFYGLPVPVTGD